MMLWFMLACGGNGGSDTGTTDACATAPVLTWENFGEGFLRENCQSCHATNAPYRSTADSPPPDGIHFDNKNNAIELADRILASSTGTAPRMPPQGGVSEEDREKLTLWLECREAQ